MIIHTKPLRSVRGRSKEKKSPPVGGEQLVADLNSYELSIYPEWLGDQTQLHSD
jgi:hypothetical protein